ncbi:MAG: hypothetical protein LUE98_01980 [Tannerellaceae bacterium]|nr:hypothetical protein [Tannerellaceae bacterium]
MNALIRELSHSHQNVENEIQLLKQAIEAANNKNELQLIELLKKIPAGIIKIAKGVGVGILGSFIAKYLGI